MTVRYNFDLYPRTDPVNGSLIGRLSDLQRAEYRGEANGSGSGLLSLRGDSSDGQLIDALGLQYVRVVADDTDAVVGGFFLDSGNFAAITKQNTRLLTFGGAGTLSYLDRETMWSHSYIGPGGMDPFDGIWRLYAQGLFAGGDHLGAVLHRVIDEAQSFPSGTYTHRHKDGETYTDSHDDDRPESAIADLVLTFDGFTDTDGSPWTLPSGEFTAQVGESVYAVVQRLMRAGLYIELDPDTFELRAWEATGHRRDRTGGAYGASVVRFSAGDNIKSDAKRKVTAFIQRSAILASTSEDVAALAVGPSDIPWHSGLRDDVGDVDALEQLATSELSRRSDAGDIVKLRMRLGASPTTGFYRPWVEVLPDDLVTVDSGSGQWDWDEAELPVAALEIKLREEGDWDAFAELGSVFSADPSREFQAAGISSHPHPQPCIPSVAGNPPVVVSAGGNIGDLGSFANVNLSIPTDLAGAALYAAVIDTGAGTIGVQWQPHQSNSGFNENFTLISATTTGSVRIGLYRLLNPTPTLSGTSFVHYTDSAAQERFVGHWYVIGVDQSDPDDAPVFANGTGSASAVAVSGGPSDLVLNAAGQWANNLSSITDPTAGGGQTSDYRDSVDRPFGQPDGEGGIGHGSGSPTWTWGASRTWVAAGIAVNSSSGTTGAINDGHRDLVGTATRWARCDHRHDVHRDSAPTVNDDWETAGYKLGTIWAQLDDLGTPTEIVGVWMLVDDATGAAVWLEISTGGGGALDDLTDVDATTPADGDVLTFDSGSGDWIAAAVAAGGGGGSISYVDATQSASPQTIASAATPTDITGCSVSLAAGNWLIFGMANFKRGSSDSAAALAIADASNNYVATARQGVIGTGGTQYSNLKTHAIVSPGSTTTYKLRATFVTGTTGIIDSSDGIHGTHATRITAIYLGSSTGSLTALGETVSTVDANQNDYNPTNLHTVDILRFTSFTAARTITGLNAGTNGEMLIMVNNTGQSLLLPHESASSSANNRFAGAAAATVTVRAGGSVMVVYTNTRWRILAI